MFRTSNYGTIVTMVSALSSKTSVSTASDRFLSGLNSGALSARWAVEVPSDWDEVGAHVVHLPALYSRAWGKYFEAYFTSDEHSRAVDLSVVFYLDGKPCGIWPLYLYRDKEKWIAGSCGGAVVPPLLVTATAERVTKDIFEAGAAAISSLALENGEAGWKGTELCFGALSPWHRLLLDKGAQVTVAHELFMDLSPELERIRATIRKSAKHQINKGLKLWKVEVHDKLVKSAFDEFHELHKAAAGRATRSDASWEAQAIAIDKKEAFLIVIRSQTGQVVGGGLFALSRTEGHYSVGAYDRSLFDMPLGHVVQYSAITFLKERGVHWYRLGDRPYRAGSPTVTDKEIAIAYFKEAFASHLFPKFQTDCPATGV